MDGVDFDALEVLGSRARMHIVITLYSNNNLSAVDFAAMLEISTPAVMRHLHLLEQAGLIVRKKVGRRNICTLRKQMVDAISAWPHLLEVSWLDMVTLEGK